MLHYCKVLSLIDASSTANDWFMRTAGVQPPQVDYGSLIFALQAACKEMGIRPVQSFLDKVIQLYETTIVRHGLMLVGPTMAGKTCCYRSLQKAMIALNAAGGSNYEKVSSIRNEQTSGFRYYPYVRCLHLT